MNIYLKELKDYRRSLFFWTLAIIAFMLSAMSKYQGYARSGTSINEVIESMPAGLSAALGFQGLDLQSSGGFFAMCTLYLSMMLGVHAVLLGAGIISKEETDKTIEFLYARPVSRGYILFSKLLAAFTQIIILNIVTAITSVVTVAAFNEGPSISSDIIFLMPSILFLQIWFLMIGASFAAIMRRPRHAGMLSAGVLLATFVISSFVDITDRFGFLKYATPFKYFDPKTIFTEHSYSMTFISITVTAVAILLTLSGIAYKKRNFSI
ncbi:MAG: ABC transporter permease subunit [Thermoleophilia bacterium]|nr:ABC transporter permease subunit [Thermoleophilia bacterium]